MNTLVCFLMAALLISWSSTRLQAAPSRAGEVPGPEISTTKTAKTAAEKQSTATQVEVEEPREAETQAAAAETQGDTAAVCEGAACLGFSRRLESLQAYHLNPEKDDHEFVFSKLDYFRYFDTLSFNRYYSYLFSPAFIYTVQSQGLQISQAELSTVIAYSDMFETYAKKQGDDALDDQVNVLNKRAWDNKYLYTEALQIYLANGIQEQQQGPLQEAPKADGKNGKTASSLRHRYNPQLFAGTTPLHMAISQKDRQAFEKLLSFCTDTTKTQSPFGIETKDALGYTPLHLALVFWAEEAGSDRRLHEHWVDRFILPLLEAGADPNTYNLRGENILHNMMRLYNVYGSSENYFSTKRVHLNPKLKSPPQWFMRKVLRRLSLNSVNQVDVRGHTPLIKMALSWSVLQRNPWFSGWPEAVAPELMGQTSGRLLEVVQTLIAQGANLAATDEYGRDIQSMVAETYALNQDRLSDEDRFFSYIRGLQKPSARPQSGYLKSKPQELGSGGLGLLEAVYDNDVPRTEQQLEANQKNLQKKRFWLDLTPYALDKSFEAAARHNLMQMMYVLRTHVDGYYTEHKKQLLVDNLDRAIESGSVGVIVELVKGGALVLPGHIVFAVQKQQLSVAQALLNLSIEQVPAVRNTASDATSLIAALNRPNFYIDLAEGLKNMPRERIQLVDKLLAPELIPAIRSGNFNMTQFIAYVSPSSVLSRQQKTREIYIPGYGGREKLSAFQSDAGLKEGVGDNIFHAMMSSSTPLDLGFARLLMARYSPYSSLRTKEGGLLYVQDAWREQNKQGKTVLQVLAQKAGQKPEHIQAYQDLLRFYADVVRDQSSVSKPGYAKRDFTDWQVLTPAEVRLFIDEFDAAWVQKADKVVAQEGRWPSHVRYKRKEVQIKSWQQLLKQYAQDPNMCEKLLAMDR